MDVMLLIPIYLFGSITFFLCMFLWLGPKYTKKRILQGLRGPEGREIMAELVKLAMEEFKKGAGKEAARQLVMTGLATLEDEIEIEGPDGKMHKTTIGQQIMANAAQNIAHYFKMHLTSELGHFSKELKGLDAELSVEGMPEFIKPYAPLLVRYFKKYPVLSMLLPLLNRGMPSGQPPSTGGYSGAGAASFGGV